MSYDIDGKIRIIGDPVLRTKCTEVTLFNPSLQILFRKMLDIMVKARGIGIAGPQVGLTYRLCVIDVTNSSKPEDLCIFNGERVDTKSIMPLFICNPEITSLKGNSPYTEGCLSIPNHRHEIFRPSELTVKFMNEKGKNVEITCDGILARCMQHEFDHLDGILFIDHENKE